LLADAKKIQVPDHDYGEIISFKRALINFCLNPAHCARHDLKCFTPVRAFRSRVSYLIILLGDAKERRVSDLRCEEQYLTSTLFCSNLARFAYYQLKIFRIASSALACTAFIIC